MEERKNEIMSPKKIAGFIAVVFSILALIAYLMPEGGIRVGGKDFYFVSLEDVLSPSKNDKINVEELMQARRDSLQARMDELRNAHYKSVQDSIDAAIELAKNDPTRLQYGNDERDGLDRFFSALQNVSGKSNAIRIIHYGDSQIEEDRITSYVRKRLQAKFGGGGVGMIAPLAITHSLSINLFSSENWTRYTAFGGSEYKAVDGRYGSTGIMCKYNNYMADSLDSVLIEKTFSSGFLTISQRKGAPETVKNFNRVRIFMGHNAGAVTVKLTYDGITDSKQIEPNTSLQVLTFELEKHPTKLTVTFSGGTSPEVYGISLETPNGIHMDNVSMRGSSGTIFHKLNSDLTKQMYAELNPKLIILQFGGNVMPYVDSKKKADNFGKEFLRNMKRIKQLCPGASFLVIGPSDMSKNIGGKMLTYPNLPDVRDALRDATFEIGGAYFDLYEVMGGENSMPSWVESTPPLAAKDYIHFSPKGAQKVAEVFYESLMLDYEQFLQRKKVKKEDDI